MKLLITWIANCFICNLLLADLQNFNFQDALRFALENAPTIKIAKKTQEVRELEHKTAFAKLLPSFDFGTTTGLQNNTSLNNTTDNMPVFTTNTTAPWYSSINFGISENLYDNGVSLINLSVADLSRDIASINYLKVRDQLILDVANGFYNFSLTHALLDVRKKQLEIINKQFKTLSNQYQQGFRTKSDFLRIKTQVKRAEIDTITAENSIILATAELHKLLGVNFNDSEPPRFLALPVHRDRNFKDLFPKVRPVLEKFYDYKIAKTQSEINDKSITLAQRNYWPQIFATTQINYFNQNYINSTTSWSALLTLKYNIWDWGTRRRAVEISENNRDIQSNLLNQNLLEVNAQITSLMGELIKINQNYDLSQELLSLEEESNRNLEAQYRDGKVTYLDLITSLNNLLDAKVQFYTSYFDALQSLAKYRYYEGKIYAALFEK